MAFAILKLSYNEAGDSSLEGGICGTGFFINETTAITAHHVLNEQTFIPNPGFRHCDVWILLSGGLIIPLESRSTKYYPDVEATAIRLDKPATETKIYELSDYSPEPNTQVLGLGHSSSGMPVTDARWEAGRLKILESDLEPFIYNREGIIIRSVEMTINANDIRLENVTGYELSFGSRVGMSGGPLIDKDTGKVLGMLSIGLPPDVQIKTQTFAVAIEEIAKLIF